MALLDVNVLLALAWPNHQFHNAAAKWFLKNKAKKWSTCALTELAFIRLSSNPAFTEEFVNPATAAALLEKMKDKNHVFLDKERSPAKITWDKIHSHKTVTDFYLLHLAVTHRVKLVTFDAGIAAINNSHTLLLA